MAGVGAICPVHGFVTAPNVVSGSGTITFVDSQVTCPVPGCGRFAKIIDGTYELVGSVVRAFREKGVTQEKVEELRYVAQAVRDGQISGQEGIERSASIFPSFEKLFALFSDNRENINTLITIITLFITLYAVVSADRSSNQQHEDEIAQLTASRSETELQRKIYQELQTRKPVKMSPAKVRAVAWPKSTVAPHPNRHERRKATAAARKPRP